MTATPSAPARITSSAFLLSMPPTPRTRQLSPAGRAATTCSMRPTPSTSVFSGPPLRTTLARQLPGNAPPPRESTWAAGGAAPPAPPRHWPPRRDARRRICCSPALPRPLPAYLPLLPRPRGPGSTRWARARVAKLGSGSLRPPGPPATPAGRGSAGDSCPQNSLPVGYASALKKAGLRK
eukprot:scaffold1959_cov243-Pinguiococcus_pyrenoidosus.AAC.4